MAVIAAIAYVVGSLPFAVLIGRLYHVDPRSQGDRNPGAWNVGRLAGRRAGMAALLLDAGKGALAAGIGMRLAGWWGGLLGMLGAMAGHSWPLLSGFRRGGRSIAVLVGAGSILAPGPAAISWTIFFFSRPLLNAKLSAAAGLLAYPPAVGLLLPDRRRFGGITLAYLLLAVRHETLQRRA